MLPELTLHTRRAIARVSQGYPWVYQDEIQWSAPGKKLAAGTLVRLIDDKKNAIATAYVNPDSTIAARVLSRTPSEKIDQAWCESRLKRALYLREQLFSIPYYRLIHSEADGMPGLVIDRFNDVFVIQSTTAGMEQLLPMLLGAMNSLFSPRSVVLRGDVPIRAKEGLNLEVKTIGEQITAPVEVIEHGTHYFANLLEGQKTGWFFDQRANHRAVAALAKNKTVLDLYSHSGGFGLAAAVNGATKVTCVDSSGPALSMGKQAAEKNKIAYKMEWVDAKVFSFLEHTTDLFDIVVADPPAFVKSKNDLQSGLRGYQKLARECAKHLGPNSLLFIASCSHHVTLENFQSMVAQGLTDAKRDAILLSTHGADRDHPQHPFLLESQYLKGLLWWVR